MRRVHANVGLKRLRDTFVAGSRHFPDNERVDLRTLREATQEQHEGVEALLPLTGSTLDVVQYKRVLQAFYAVVQGWETWAAVHVPTRLKALIQERQRAPLLLRDLHFFGLGLGPGPGSGWALPNGNLQGIHCLLTGVRPDSEQHEAVFLGAMYVMEGSTLGGQYIARHVERLFGLAPGKGDAYFRGYGEQTGAMWSAFRHMLGAVPEQHTDTVIAAAKATFAYVHEGMLSCGPMLSSQDQPPLSGPLT